MKIISLMIGTIIFLMGIFSSCKKSKCIDKDAINPNAVCIQLYAPVCGCDGVTYSNDCYAKNAGVKTWTQGECR